MDVSIVTHLFITFDLNSDSEYMLHIYIKIQYSLIDELHLKLKIENLFFFLSVQTYTLVIIRSENLPFHLHGQYHISCSLECLYIYNHIKIQHTQALFVLFNVGSAEAAIGTCSCMFFFSALLHPYRHTIFYFLFRFGAIRRDEHIHTHTQSNVQ